MLSLTVATATATTTTTATATNVNHCRHCACCPLVIYNTPGLIFVFTASWCLITIIIIGVNVIVLDVTTHQKGP
jgi:hypothetical protein